MMPQTGLSSLSTRSRIVAAAVCQPLAASPRKIVSLGLLVEMERLRIELAGKALDPLVGEPQPAGAEGLSDGKILEISPGHCGFLPRRKGMYGRVHRTGPNQAPPATAAALIRPKAASATASERKTWVMLPLKRSASQPPAAAIARRVRFATSGQR